MSGSEGQKVSEYLRYSRTENDSRCSTPVSFQYVYSAFCSSSIVSRKHSAVSMQTSTLSVWDQIRCTYYRH